MNPLDRPPQSSPTGPTNCRCTARIAPNRIRRGTALSRHTLSEIEALSLPRLQTALSEAVAYGELGFSGALPMVGTAAAEIAALVAELRNQGWLDATM